MQRQREPFQGGLECEAVAELRYHPAQLDRRSPPAWASSHQRHSRPYTQIQVELWAVMPLTMFTVYGRNSDGQVAVVLH